MRFRYLSFPLALLLPFVLVAIGSEDGNRTASVAAGSTTVVERPTPADDLGWLVAQAERERTAHAAAEQAAAERVAAEAQAAAEAKAAAEAAEAAHVAEHARQAEAAEAASAAKLAEAEDATRASKVRVAPAPEASSPRQQTGGDLGSRIADCESGGSYTAQNPSSSASGKYQFLDTTWNGYGGYESAKDAPPAVQEEYFAQHYAENGTTPWNASRHCWG